MWGFRFQPQPTTDQGVTRVELYPCAHKCRKAGTRLLDTDEQARRNCTLPGVDRTTWTGEAFDLVHLGAPPNYDGEGEEPDWDAPTEPPEEGCPGSWYRTAFITSLLRYYRRRDEHGGRIANPELDRTDDPLIHEAIRELEQHEEAAFGEYLDYVRSRRPQP